MMNTHKQTYAFMPEANEAEASYVKKALDPVLSLYTTPDVFSKHNDADLSQVEILIPFVHSFIGEAEIAAMPQLKLIATRSTGYDHIDLRAASAKGIVVENVPGYGETAVAEYTFALLLALSRKIKQAWSQMRNSSYTMDELRGFDLYHKTIGVIGTGSIGLHVIRIARGFGMNVLAYDVVHNQLLAEVLGFQYVTLNELLSQADVVTLHAPANAATYHMINQETLAQVKRGAILINTARGSLVDTRALAWALDTHILAAAGLDTIEGEEFLKHEEELLKVSDAEEKLKLLVSNTVLLRQPNVIITPHIAFNSEEALLRILDTTIANVKAFLDGHQQNTVH